MNHNDPSAFAEVLKPKIADCLLKLGLPDRMQVSSMDLLREPGLHDCN
jgi:hypothetical protein